MVPARVNVVFNVIKQKKKKKERNSVSNAATRIIIKKKIIQHTDLVSVEDQGEV